MPPNLGVTRGVRRGSHSSGSGASLVVGSWLSTLTFWAWFNPQESVCFGWFYWAILIYQLVWESRCGEGGAQALSGFALRLGILRNLQSSGFVLPGTCQHHTLRERLPALLCFTVIPVEKSAPARPSLWECPWGCQARASAGVRGSPVSRALPAGFVTLCHALPDLVSQAPSPPWLRCQLLECPKYLLGYMCHGGGAVGLEERCRMARMGCATVPGPIPCAACGWSPQEESWSP